MGCCRKEKKPPAQKGDKAICGTLCVCQVIFIIDGGDDEDSSKSKKLALLIMMITMIMMNHKDHHDDNALMSFQVSF